MNKQSDYLIFGRKVVKKIIRSHNTLIRKIIVTKDNNDILEFAGQKNILYELKTATDLDSLVEGNHQGVIAIMKEYNFVPFSKILSSQNILILDRINDPHNFGAIIRSAALFGYNSILILDHKQCDITPTVAKVSAGTLYDVHICKVSNLANAISELKKSGFWIYSSYLSDDSIDIKKIDFDSKNAIVIGNEGEGISNKIAELSDFKFKIKTEDIIDSLNVSVASGIILFQATKNKS